ncbi:MAG: pectin acetylesterase-family hydrolase [Anaerolineaceae bacterium]|nr:pectin acetylesterase-family hydrolase [Anaerolineaceae bacterium]
MRRKILLTICTLLAIPMMAVSAQESVWETIAVPEGVCARGTPYSFFHREGSSEDLLIFFEGGGACWDGATCQFGADYTSGGPLFKDTVYFPGDEEARGIFSLEHEANPFAEYDIVYVPYCSADVHTGSAERVYEVPENSLSRRAYPVRIHHQGAVNAAAVLAWTYEHYAEPSSVALLGCSAGSYGAIYHAHDIMSQYPDVRVTHLSDAGVGHVPPGWQAFENWAFLDRLPAAIREAGPLTYETFSLNDLYSHTAAAFPHQTFAQYTTAADEVQIRFYAIQGGDPNDWPPGMQARLTELITTVPNFNGYIAGGSEHCILPEPEFYTTEVAGVNFRDWLAARLAGEATGNVICDLAGGECFP